jgi:hypothetical protein
MGTGIVDCTVVVVLEARAGAAVVDVVVAPAIAGAIVATDT